MVLCNILFLCSFHDVFLLLAFSGWDCFQQWLSQVDIVFLSGTLHFMKSMDILLSLHFKLISVLLPVNAILCSLCCGSVTPFKFPSGEDTEMEWQSEDSMKKDMAG